MCNNSVSTRGAHKLLLRKLEENEIYRRNVFRGRFSSEFVNDKLKAAIIKNESDYSAGLMYIE